MFWTGTEGVRVWALGVLEARPELATPRVVIDAILRPDYMFDQYPGLLLAEVFLFQSTTRAWTRERILKAVRTVRDSGALGTDHDCLAVTARILATNETQIGLNSFLVTYVHRYLLSLGKVGTEGVRLAAKVKPGAELIVRKRPDRCI